MSRDGVLEPHVGNGFENYSEWQQHADDDACCAGARGFYCCTSIPDLQTKLSSYMIHLGKHNAIPTQGEKGGVPHPPGEGVKQLKESPSPQPPYEKSNHDRRHLVKKGNRVSG